MIPVQLEAANARYQFGKRMQKLISRVSADWGI